MAERFIRLFTLPNNLYSKGTPVIVEAGALLKDNETGRIVGQLKIKSISEKAIKAVKVKLKAKDTVGKLLDDEIVYDYLDLKIARDDEFGQKKAIVFPNPSTRSFDIDWLEVAFSDNSLYCSSNEVWAPISPQESIQLAFKDEMIVDQYQKKFGEKALMKAKKKDDIWLCTCGAINSIDELSCHICGNNIDDLLGCDISELKKDAIYYSAEAKMKANSINSYTDAIKGFESISGWKDSYEKIQICKTRIEEIEAKQELDRIERENSAKKLKKTAKIAVPALIVCIIVAFIISKVIIPNSNYNKALSLKESGEYDAAIVAFEELKGYKDSADQIQACKVAIQDNDYKEAVALMESGKYYEAIAAFEKLNGYKDSADQIKECKYNRALELIDASDYEAAFRVLDGLNYKDSNDLLDSIKVQNEIALISKAGIGSTVLFGSYEQDNVSANGSEDVEWIVLAKDNNRVLVISKYALDVQPFNTTDTDVAWNTCSLRKWLNSTFVNAAFSKEEQAVIPEVNISTDNIEDTKDRVFLLSNQEAQKYFKSDAERQCEVTTYVDEIGVSGLITGGKHFCLWWLRTPGRRSDEMTYVTSEGGFYDGAHVIDRNGNGIKEGVRPALWIEIE